MLSSFFFQFLLWSESPLFSVPVMVGITSFFECYLVALLFYAFLHNIITYVLIIYHKIVILSIFWWHFVKIYVIQFHIVTTHIIHIFYNLSKLIKISRKNIELLKELFNILQYLISTIDFYHFIIYKICIITCQKTDNFTNFIWFSKSSFIDFICFFLY